MLTISNTMYCTNIIALLSRYSLRTTSFSVMNKKRRMESKLGALEGTALFQSATIVAIVVLHLPNKPEVRSVGFASYFFASSSTILCSSSMNMSDAAQLSRTIIFSLPKNDCSTNKPYSRASACLRDLLQFE